MFRLNQDVIRLRLSTAAVRSHEIDVVHTDDPCRVIAFRRRDGQHEVLVVGSLNNAAFDQPGYVLTQPSLYDHRWRERCNSDSHLYGRDDDGNAPAGAGAELSVVVPANGFVVLFKTS